MAKKAKKGEEAEAGAEGEAPAGGGKKKLIIIAAAALLVLGGGGGGAFFYFKGKAHKEAEAPPPKKPVAFLELREMTVNLASEAVANDRPRFLRFKVSLELKESKVLPEVQPLVPRIEDAFQVFVRELRASDLEGSVGLYRMREELLRRVNIATYPAKVDAVLFKDVVVQ